MRHIVLSLCLTMPGAVLAGQPISESFVECAQLMDMSNRQYPERQSTEKGVALAYAAAQLMQAAADEAAREGRYNIPTYLTDLAFEKASSWDSKGMTYVFSQDFRDWMSYCRKLSKSRGVKLTR